jgi:IS5 family transposase
MRDKVTLTEKCIELGNRATDDEDGPAAPEGGGGFSEAFKLAVNMLRIGAEETYRSLEALLEHTPAIRDELEIDEDDIPDYSTVCKWYQEIMMEVWRLLLRHSAEIAGTSGRAAIDSTFFERHQASSHYISRTDYTFDKLKVTLLVDIESQAVVDFHCTTRKTHDTQIGMQVARRNAEDLHLLLGDKGYDWQELRDFLRGHDVRPLIKHREFTSLDVAHNARMDGDLYGQRSKAETVNASIKQRYGSELTATTWYGEFRELAIKCIVHNLRRAVK